MAGGHASAARLVALALAGCHAKAGESHLGSSSPAPSPVPAARIAATVHAQPLERETWPSILPLDADGDSAPDLAFATGDGSWLVEGPFSGDVPVGIGADSAILASADLGGGPALELVVLSRSSLELLEPPFHWGWAADGAPFATLGIDEQTGLSHVATGDVSGDGIDDLAVSPSYGPSIGVFAGPLHGEYGAEAALAIPADPAGVAITASIADLDGDGVADLFGPGTGGDPGAADLWIAPGPVDFGSVFAPIGAAGVAPLGPAHAADLDGDGSVELVTELEHDTAGVFRLDGSLVAVVDSSLGDPPPLYPVGLAVGDVDGDGAGDLVTRSETGVVLLWLGPPADWSDADQALALPGTGDVVVGPGLIDLFDVDGDGRSDLWFSSAHGPVPVDDGESFQPSALLVLGSDSGLL